MKVSVALVAAMAAVAGAERIANVEAHVTDPPALEKRYKEVVVNKDYKKIMLLKQHGGASATPLKPWVRTIYETKVEIVLPTVVAGVTFSAKPPATTNGLEPWILLKNDGSPKTIKPKMKDGTIRDKSPDYGTWFQTATTVKYTKEELKAHNMADDEVFTHEELIPEDLTYRTLNPVLRCTPALYKMKGMAKDILPEPFCFPRDNAVLYMDKTYFVTWFHRFFDDDVKNVKLHLSYVKESMRQKGLKRDLADEPKDQFDKRLSVMEKGGTMGRASFFATDWLPKDSGMYALEVLPEWLEGDFSRKVLLSLQPDTMEDEEFNHMANYVVVEFAQRAKVAKGHQEDLKLQHQKAEMKALYGDAYDIEEGLDYEKYMVILTMPMCVMVAVLLMYAFVYYNSLDHDLSFLKKVKFAKKKKKSKLPFQKSKYAELPQWDGPKAD